jgi:hypothetical protein
MSYFNDVLLYHDAVRKDDVYYEDKKLTQDQVQALCDETGSDAVISLDRMLFESKKNVVAFAEGYVEGEIQVKMSGVVRGYLPNRPNPLATVYVADSLFFMEDAPNLILLDLHPRMLYVLLPNTLERRPVLILYLTGIAKRAGIIMLWDPVGKRLLPMRNQKNGIRLLNTGCISMKNQVVRKPKPKLLPIWRWVMK